MRMMKLGINTLLVIASLALALTGATVIARADDAGCTDWVCSSNGDCDSGCHCCIAADGLGGNCCK
jgi:hypothetical protein